MPVELKIPQAGESITEVEIGEWLKREGDRVERDETLVTLETDKAAMELPAPASGVLARVLRKSGEIAKPGEVIGILVEPGEGPVLEAPAAGAPPREAAPPSPSEARPPASQAATAPKGLPGEEAARADRAALGEGTAPAAPRVMPAAERLLAQGGIRPEDVAATGPGGRLTKEDAQRHIEARPQETPLPEPREAAPVEESPLEAPGAASAREEEVVPMNLLRRRIAERLVEAQHTAALLTTFNEADMTAVMALRRKYQDAFQERYRIKLGFMSFFVKACVDALKQLPALNAEVRGTDIVYRNYHDIGIAIGGGRGLVVPVLRNAERLSFAEIERAIDDLARRARENKLKVEELQGGTFTITNGGIYGSLLSTPIINPPQSGILGMHAIQERPVAREGQVVIRPMMYIALTYDHRIVDGREAVTFLRRVKEAIEDPARMLVEV